MVRHPTRDAGFGVYVHWPFCLSKCPYCDFNSHVRHQPVDQARFVAAFRREIGSLAARLPGRTVTSIFLGGGTPSLMKPETVSGVLEAIAGAWTVAPDAEVTLEANPTSVEAERFAGYRSAGVNLVSLGVQALDDADLRRLGRLHSVAEALDALRIAVSQFERVSFDLIYARPGQEPDAWRQELRAALGQGVDHLSLYQLTIEPGTAFATAHARGELVLPEEEDAAALYELTQERLAAAGMPAYEVSNHARPGGECRHNLVYWRHEDYVGIGPGAHGRLTQDGHTIATRQLRAPETWLAAVERDGHGTQERVPLSSREAAEEALMMGLRLDEGVKRSAVREAIDERRVRDLVEGGFLIDDPARLRTTPAGRQRLNAVLGALLAND
jgi:putative oxygen-independent coproporphyrinogen III oxidase